MLILPLYTYVVARLVVLAIKRLLSSYLRDLQAVDSIALLCRSALGWPATILLCIALGLLCAALGIDDSLWHSLLDFPHYWPICFWLVGAATTRPLLEGEEELSEVPSPVQRFVCVSAVVLLAARSLRQDIHV